MGHGPCTNYINTEVTLRKIKSFSSRLFVLILKSYSSCSLPGRAAISGSPNPTLSPRAAPISSALSLATALKGKKRPRAVGHPPHPVGAWPEGPSPGFLLETTQDRAISPPTLASPKLMGWLCPQRPSQFRGASGLPREGELGQGGGREKRHKKKLNILKIYIYRFVFTSSPQIKSSKSTLSKAAGRRGGKTGEHGWFPPSQQPLEFRRERQGRAGRPGNLLCWSTGPAAQEL